jgi:hypothetical protein
MTDLNIYLKEAIQKADREFSFGKSSLADYELSTCINKERQSQRSFQNMTAWENGFHRDWPMDPDEFDPLDWVEPTADQLKEVEKLKLSILEPLKNCKISFCASCSIILQPDWTVCPRCTHVPSHSTLAEICVMLCSRCQRLGMPAHPLDNVYCPYHGLKLELGYH